jgi:hypothetical protein
LAKDSDEYKLTLNGGGLNLTRTVSEATAQQIVGLVLGGAAAVPATAAGAQPGVNGQPQSSHGLTPKAFLVLKRPATDVERVSCLAWFLTNERNVPAFKTKVLTDLNREAAQFKLSNPSATARNAVNDGYLAAAGGGQKQITARGEALVEALPDRDKVKAALEAHPARRRKPSAKKAKK